VASSQITEYAALISATLARALGPAAPTSKLNELASAANELALLIDAATVSASDWQTAINRWETARSQLMSELKAFLVDGLPDLPGLDDLLREVGWDSPDGLHGDLDIGPVHLAFASSSLVIQPPTLTGLPPGTPPLPPVVLGPYQPSSIAASIKSPFSSGDSGLPGGGSIVRLPTNDGFGGTLQVPLGVVQVDAAAVLQQLPDGTPSFIAILGISFLPPIQLSFGFSLDRVGGIVGVNRTADTDALTHAVRTGAAGDVLFAVRPPSSPAALAGNVTQLFPPHAGRHLIGPSLKLSWLSFGEAGSLLGLNLAVIVEIPTGKVLILGVAQATIPGLPGLLNLRLDVLGIIDPQQQLVSIDASLVDSHVLGTFTVYGDAALRLCWGSQAYLVISVGGFYPGFNPEPAHLPAMRRIGMSPELPLPLTIRAEGYFAITSNTLQLGGRLEITFEAGLEAHGFLQVDALVQFRPFHFVANCSAGFDVGVAGFSFGGVRLDGTISGPGPLVIRGRLTIETFLFDISWDQSFTIGDGPGDTLPSPPSLLDVLAEELAKTANLHAATEQDPDVVLHPRSVRPGIAAVPPTGALRFEQRRAPLGVLIERVDGRPLGSPMGAHLLTPGTPTRAQFGPGSYLILTDSEALSRPPFDILDDGALLAPAEPDQNAVPHIDDTRQVLEIVIYNGVRLLPYAGKLGLLTHLIVLIGASRAPAALSDASPMVTANREQWVVTQPGTISEPYQSATAAHQFAKHYGGVGLAAADAATPVDLVGV
jgi:hypothetical protein